MDIYEIREKLILAIENSLDSISKKIPREKPQEPPKIELEVPKENKFGDFTTNIAMRLSKYYSLPAVELARLIKEELDGALRAEGLEKTIKKVDVLPPGFVNFWLGEEYLCGVLSDIQKEKSKFGKNTVGKGKHVNIEFVSANPTGPLTVAHGRQAAVGDALGRILAFSGYNVTREYFINDVGIQIGLLGKSIHARYSELLGIDSGLPEDGYHGEYIKDIAAQLKQKYGLRFAENSADNLDFIARYGSDSILKTIEKDLKEFGVLFDVWFSQRKLSNSTVKGILDKIRQKGYIYDKDGAVWFKSTAFGDDKDRVVIKSDGAFTYLAPDIAYHVNKFSRHFDRLIDIWGPDHHGYIPRLVASCEALGYDKGRISILIVQLATLFRNGEALSMSTRKGEFITLREVMNEVGCDVAKFFFLMRKLDSHLDFDLEVAKKDSLENPVYYIQYAHARISSILNFSEKLKNRLKGIKCDTRLLNQAEDIQLLKMLCQFPPAVESSARMLEPFVVIDYLNTLAKAFHGFYARHRVVSEDNLELTKARLELVNSVKIVLANGLGLLGISFPEHM